MKRFFAILMFIGLLFSAGCGAEDKWVRKLKSSDPQERIEAAKKLGEMGTTTALTELTLVQDDKDHDVRLAIKEAIKKISGQTFFK